ncbi:oxidoreductase [Mycobacterium sp. HM-7]
MTDHAQDFAGQRVLVTGGTRGMGEATAKRFAAPGAQVFVTARDAPSDGFPATFIAADLSTETGVTTLGRRIIDEAGGIDILINNAGAASALEPTLEASDVNWTDALALNLLSAVRLDRILVPGMIERGSGVVVHVSSVLSRQPQTGQVPYAAAKAALNVYSRQLATEVGPHGVRVLTVLPGFINTPGSAAFVQKMADSQGSDVDQLLSGLSDQLGPLGQVGQPDDIAEMIAFLASSRAKYLTGAQFRVDGGLLPVV